METLRGVRAARPPVAELPLDLGPVIHTSTPAPVIALFGADEDAFLAALPSPPPSRLASSRPASRPRAPRRSPPRPGRCRPCRPCRGRPRAERAPRRDGPAAADAGPAHPAAGGAHPAAQPRPQGAAAAGDHPGQRRVALAPRPPPLDFAPHAAEAPPAPAPAASPKDPVAYNFRMWALFAVAGIVFAVGARSRAITTSSLSRSRRRPSRPRSPSRPPPPRPPSPPRRPPRGPQGPRREQGQPHPPDRVTSS